MIRKIKYPLLCRENSSSLESCKDGICSATSSTEMTSVRTCYCKQKDVSRKKDDDIADRNWHPSTAISKRLIKNKVTAYKSNRESPKREKSDEKMVLNDFFFFTQHI